MAKSKGGKFYNAMLAGTGIHRIDGIVREVNDAGVVIDIKEAGRQKRTATLIPMADIVCHTAEGAGFVIADMKHELEPIAGEVVSEDESGIVLKDTDGTEITFPTRGARGGVQFAQVGEDDRSLKRSAVSTRVTRLAEREDGSDGGKSKKKKKKSEKSDGDDKKSKSGKARRRRR